MQFPILCLVTSGEGPSPGVVREAASAGVDLVQLREPLLDAAALLAFARQAVRDAAGSPCRIVVNDRVDVAIAADAPGVHLRANSFSASRVRSIAPAGFLIGRSVHEAAEAVAAADDGGCDYLVFGTVFPSRSKPPGHRAAGLRALHDVCRSTSLPVIAIGGISVENAREAIAAGARGVAGIGLFRAGDPISSVVSRIRQRFDT